MNRGLALGLISLFLVSLLSLASAQEPWLITPGKAWGPISIGMEEGDVLRILGTPISRSDSGQGVAGVLIHWVTYQNAVLSFWKQNDGRYTLVSINTSDRNSVTREGIRIGSSLADVLRTYGNTTDNIETTRELRYCLEILLNSRGQTAQTPNYNYQWLTLSYPARGIDVDFILDTAGKETFNPPKVIGIEINRADADLCHKTVLGP